MMCSQRVYSSAQQRRCHAPRCATRPPSSRMFTHWPLSAQEALQASYTASAMINTSRQIFITAPRKQITDAAPKAVIFLPCFIALLFGRGLEYSEEIVKCKSTACPRNRLGNDKETLRFLNWVFSFPTILWLPLNNFRGLSRRTELMPRRWLAPDD